jgi:hypothetical protein
MRTIKINTSTDLLSLAEQNVLTPDHFKYLLEQFRPFLGIFLNEYSNTAEMGKILKECLEQYKNEQPVFFDLEL